ncbi:hypothetical protein ACFPRL_18665 [Pseudoclavibacter helvolus]
MKRKLAPHTSDRTTKAATVPRVLPASRVLPEGLMGLIVGRTPA